MKFRVFSSRAVLEVILLLLFIAVIPASAQSESHEHLFGLSMNAGVIGWNPEPWPSVPFTGMRLWDTNTAWQNISSADGQYDWTDLDKWLTAAGANNNNVLYTFGGIPQWASSNPNDPICNPSPGVCDPPVDVNPDGSGTDQYWKNFVTALVQHNQNSPGARITNWEMWNEPHNNFFWNGTYAQLVRMVGDAYAIIKAADPSALILSPSVGWQSKEPMQWFAGYVAAGGGQYVERISCHGYSKKDNQYGPPENMVTFLGPYRTSLAALGFASTPIWDTEANWGAGLLTNQDMQAAWVSRFYILHAANGIRRLYWFLWNGSAQGGLWAPNPQDHSKPGTLLEPGIAYQNISPWIIGAKFSSCSQSGTVWTCGLSRPGGYEGLAVWDTSQTCHQGQCGTTNYTFNGNYVNYKTVDGDEVQITGSTVPIGAKPILLQNQ